MQDKTENKVEKNKGGRPKGSISNATKEALIFRQFLANRIKREKKPLIDALMTKAKAGDVPALKELFDRAFGKAKESIELMGEGGGPVELAMTLKSKIDKIYG